MIYYTYTQTPVGKLMLVGDGLVINALYWVVYKYTPKPKADWKEDPLKFTTVQKQLEEYFAGDREEFDFPMLAHGTPFQKLVWKELRQIKYGETSTYQQIAYAIGLPHAARAVGAAIGRNPLSIIVPCHRVIASNGKLTGFAGGLASKRSLLEHEGILLKSLGTLKTQKKG